ncbi:hypothetical protein D6C90_00817 [Aureobasidium pullulans]|uniref:F-box domain-containing protein n=1 Tax=Aureobasidium pullulans TaxID=5580 RepID=A0A4S9VLC5_AURPU|nr:hypothetical protein D6C90_00817 [Aureobasidium pullulans]
MDALPLEIKENICSFLSPSHLKPLRLVSKEFASAAIPYFISRIFLFNHPDSCIEMNAILRHPEIPKYINTLIVDPSAVQSNCPNLKNFILTSIHGRNVLRKRDDIFHELLLEHLPHSPETGPKSYLPSGEVVAESLQTITLNNIEINNWDCGILRNLRHLRVSLRDCGNRPSSQFDAMVHSATRLETLWIEFPYSHDGLYSIDSLFNGIRLKKLHECLLSYVSVSEDELVDFLLHHAQSLRTFGIGGSCLHKGSWPSLFRRLSCQMAILKQFATSRQLLANGHDYTGSYLTAVTRFVLHGGPEPVETFREDFPHDYENRPNIIHVVQDGLWKDYDRMIKPYL